MGWISVLAMFRKSRAEWKEGGVQLTSNFLLHGDFCPARKPTTFQDVMQTYQQPPQMSKTQNTVTIHFNFLFWSTKVTDGSTIILGKVCNTGIHMVTGNEMQQFSRRQNGEKIFHRFKRCAIYKKNCNIKPSTDHCKETDIGSLWRKPQITMRYHYLKDLIWGYNPYLMVLMNFTFFHSNGKPDNNGGQQHRG